MDMFGDDSDEEVLNINYMGLNIHKKTLISEGFKYYKIYKYKTN